MFEAFTAIALWCAQPSEFRGREDVDNCRAAIINCLKKNHPIQFFGYVDRAECFEKVKLKDEK